MIQLQFRQHMLTRDLSLQLYFISQEQICQLIVS